ncbi:MAG: bestrophin family ion channel, partial [Planctomycetota bacterium]
AWALLVTVLHVLFPRWPLLLPALPVTLIGTAVAFYLGFRNSSSYGRLWEARQIWGGIVNASRSWAVATRDLVVAAPGLDGPELDAVRFSLVRRHVAWLDALRHALRTPREWEHTSPADHRLRRELGMPERQESLEEVVAASVGVDEATEVCAGINTSAHLLSRQSQAVADLRARGALDGFSHIHLQRLVDEFYALQGKSERIKNFPFPRQYATVVTYFAGLFVLLLPCALLAPFSGLGPVWVWLTAPFSGLVGWVFLTADKIGDASENPFEGLYNDVPITTMARGIERDVLELVGVGKADLPPARSAQNGIQF